MRRYGKDCRLPPTKEGGGKRARDEDSLVKSRFVLQKLAPGNKIKRDLSIVSLQVLSNGGSADFY